MIRSAYFQNIRCLRDVRIDFEPLTALVGANASGKSTILRALGENFPLSRDTTWLKQPLPQKIELQHEGGWCRHERGPRDSGQRGSRSLPQGYFSLLHLNPDAMRRSVQVKAEPRLSTEGGNLANVFATLSRTKQVEVAKALARLVPVIRDVDLRPAGDFRGGQHHLRFWDRWQEEVWYAPSEVSDGTILMLGFLVLQHQESAPMVVGIEEPERGLHPYLLQQLVQFLRSLSKGEIGPRAVQVILATHSAELLDCLEPGEVRFLDRNDDGSVRVETPPVDEPGFKKALEEYQHSLGEAWLSGGLGGVPGD